MTKKIKDLTLQECRNICKKYYTKTYARCKECPLSHEPKICNGMLMAFYADVIQAYKEGRQDNYLYYEYETLQELLEGVLLDPNKEIKL